jgi:hypothetical protein
MSCAAGEVAGKGTSPRDGERGVNPVGIVRGGVRGLRWG